MKKTLLIYTQCTQDGMHEQLLILEPNQIIFEATIESEDGTFYLEYVVGGQDNSAYFMEKLVVESETEITIKR